MNKYFISATIIIISSLLIGVTSFKVIKSHNEKLILVKEKYIIEKGLECIYDDKCNEEKVTLKELQELNYLSKEVNPVTKEYYNENSYITKENDKYVFISVPN